MKDTKNIQKFDELCEAFMNSNGSDRIIMKTMDAYLDVCRVLGRYRTVDFTVDDLINALVKAEFYGNVMSKMSMIDEEKEMRKVEDLFNYECLHH